jgi:hypothetical protein
VNDEYKLQQDASRGARAKQILEDPILIEAFDAIRADYLEKLVSTTTMETAAREKLYMGVRVLDEVKAHFNTVIARGAVAVSDLSSLAEVAERRKKFGVF